MLERRLRQCHSDLHVEGLGPVENALMFADSLAVFTDHGSTLQIRKVSVGDLQKKKSHSME